MGAITTGFDLVPIEGTPAAVRAYEGVYEDLGALGLALPAQGAGVVTRAQLVAHLRGLVGDLVKGEIDTDSEGIYGGLTNAQIATLIGSEYAPRVPDRFPGADPAGYVVTASSRNGLQATVVGGGVPGFDALLVNSVTGLLKTTIYIRFRNNTTTALLRGRHARLDGAPSPDTLTFAVEAPAAPPAGNVFDVGFLRGETIPPRLVRVLARLPFAPNQLTEADIIGARS